MAFAKQPVSREVQQRLREVTGNNYKARRSLTCTFGSE